MDYLPRVNIEDYRFVEVIGSGQFGTVSLIEEKKTDIKYAAKEEKSAEDKITYEIDEESSLKNTLIRELETYAKIKNAAILNFIGYSQFDLNNFPNKTIITDYMPNGSLDKMFKDVYHVCAPIKYSNNVRYIILLGIALGMKDMHNKGVIHRDLKPGNVLLDENLYPKICDFGCSKVSDAELTQILMRSQIGTPMYMAPEIFDDNNNYNYKVDVYAYSLIAYEIIAQRKPFEGKFTSFQLIENVINGYRPDTSTIGDNKIVKFLEKCWSKYQIERPSFLQIVDELMQEHFKNYFGIDDDDDEINEYLDLFDDELKSPLSKDALDVKKEADKGNVEAIFHYASMLHSGIGVPINIEEAVKYYKKGIEKGDQRCMLNYGIMLHDGEVIPSDKKESARLFKMATNVEQAQYNLATMYLNGDGITVDINEGIKLMKKAADMGSVDAMFSLANIYKYGKITPANYKESAHYFKLAADFGDVRSMFYYGEMLSEGIAVDINKKKAASYLKRAADNGFYHAMKNYGIMLIDGEGIPVDYDEGIRYLEMAAKKNLDDTYKVLYLALFKKNGYSLDIFFEAVRKYFLNPIPFNTEMKKALLYMKKSADLNDDKTCFFYGFMKYIGFGMEANREEAMKYIIKSYENGYKEAFKICGTFIYSFFGPECGNESFTFFKLNAEKGDIESMMLCYLFLSENNFEQYGEFSQLANKFEFELLKGVKIPFKGKRIEKNPKEALKYLKMAADKGDTLAMRLYSEKMFEELQKPKEAVDYLKIAADNGDIDAMKQYGVRLIDGNKIAKNPIEGARYIKMAACNGDYEAIAKYAELLYHGIGVTINKKGAAKYYKVAADSGIEEAMYSYARMLRHGEGIQKNIQESIKYYKKAIDKGNSLSMINYGHMLFNGEGIPVNKVEAARYYKMASDHGYTNAMINIGRMLFYGEGIPKNQEEGINYFKKAADLDNEQSMFIYGKILYEGDGIPANKKEGYKYISKSAGKGYLPAMSYITSLNEKTNAKKTTHIKKENESFNDIKKFSFNVNKNVNIDAPTNKTIQDICIYTYQSMKFENENFLYISEFSFPNNVFNKLSQNLQTLSFYKSKQGNLIHPEDPNKPYTFFYFSLLDPINIIMKLNQTMNEYGISHERITFNKDLYFEEHLIQQSVLDILLNQLKEIKEINSIKRNIFDGRQVSTYIYTSFLDQKIVIDSLRRSLLKKDIIIDTFLYPLLNNIVINEDLILGTKNDFNIIVNEIKSFGIDPIKIYRNKLYLYNENYLKKLFQVFSFICFQNENDKMKALNHINSILFRNKPNILKYKLNLHYASINSYNSTKTIRENIVQVFESFEGVNDVQHNVLNVESPCRRTYIGFDSIRNMKKAYKKFLKYKNWGIMMERFNPNFNTKLFIPKNNLIYLKIRINKRDPIEISNILYPLSRNASDYQDNCIDVYDYGVMELSSFLGFNTMNKYSKVYNLLCSHPKIANDDIAKYNQNDDIPIIDNDYFEESYIYYDSF